ncbi:MAG TPA: hypothetical protein PLM09_02480 [Casimicrobiaceae bacterium]|nr:hypothetical protein [Casimicrobiaceae bacterium]
MSFRRALRMGVAASFVAIAPGGEAQAPERCDHCGTITDIRQSTSKSTWTPLGSTAPGTTVGGDETFAPGRVTATYQVGRDLKNQGMVLLGSAGGGSYARRPDEYVQTRFDLTVKMDAGGPPRTVSLSYEPPFQVGDRVRVFGTQLELIQP